MSENKNVPSSLHYPKARVILGFLLMGGGLGGWLFWATLGVYNALGWYGQEALQGSGDFVDLVLGFFLLGSAFGFIPSVLCGWWLAENRFFLHGLALFVAAAGVWFADFKRGIHLAAAFGAAHRTLRCVERGDIGPNFVSERFE